MRTWLVGLDVGTTSCKAVVMAPDGREVASGRAPTPWTTTALGTQTEGEALVKPPDPRWQARLPPHRRTHRGSRSSEHGRVRRAAGQARRAIGPVIAWHDTRDEAETAGLRAELGAEFSVRTGLPLRRQWSLTKHRWQLDHDDATTTSVRGSGWRNGSSTRSAASR